jgi:hypothetical protein
MKLFRRSIRLAIVTAAVSACLILSSPLSSYATGEQPKKIDPDNFVKEVTNPYFPLVRGSKMIFHGQTKDGFERIELEVLKITKDVMGISATVLQDRVFLNGELVEDTLDWFAQDKEGNVWYLGESVKNYKDGIFDNGDGSWESGVDGALPGIIMFNNPEKHIGETYRQEYYKGKAEDMADLLNAEKQLLTHLGSFSDIVQTLDYTPLEPGVEEHKFYARGIGVVKEVDLTTGDEMHLVYYIPAESAHISEE